VLRKVFDHILNRDGVEQWEMFGSFRDHERCSRSAIRVREPPAKAFLAGAAIAFTHQEYLVVAVSAKAIASDEDLIVEEIAECLVVTRTAHQNLQGGGSPVGLIMRALKVKL
jgi:hypothetical protein